MKNLAFVFFLGFLIITLNSCDDQVEPKTDFSQVYTLNCIIRTDSSFQVATITRSYNVDGYDPYTNTDDPFIKGAKVRIYYNNNVYNLKDTSIARSADSRYKAPINFYYTKNLFPQHSLPIRIEAELPNGKVLSSSGEIISPNTLYLYSSSPSIPSLNPTSRINFNWGELGLIYRTKGVYYAPELAILYTHEKDGVKTNYQKKVAMYYIPGSPDKQPVYPQIQTNILSAGFEIDAITRAMEEISSGDPNKKNYRIEKAFFRLLAMDAGLATFYSAQKIFLDEFSVRLNQPEITNITGGLGVFGTYTIKNIELEIQPAFIESFGYRY
ncbi:MAG: DUF4249 family protein [Ignavibacteria bacterium]|nr:DUF4249 family protein [Ignavibacteria bacterium]